jgi:hypothetical protein
MWIGAVRLVVKTKDRRFAGTDSEVQMGVLRNGWELAYGPLDKASVDDHERGDERAYDFIFNDWFNDRTQPIDFDPSPNPPPYPDRGIEYSNGLGGHFGIRLRIMGADMWIKDELHIYTKQIRLKSTSQSEPSWRIDADWHYEGSSLTDVRMSTDWWNDANTVGSVDYEVP